MVNSSILLGKIHGKNSLTDKDLYTVLLMSGCEKIPMRTITIYQPKQEKKITDFIHMKPECIEKFKFVRIKE